MADRFPYVPAVLKNQVAEVRTVAGTKEQQEVAIRKKNEKKYLRRVFDRVDVDGDGILSEEEVAAYLTKIGYAPTLGEVQKLIWEVDDDADGVICWKEFQEYHIRMVNYDFESSKVAYEPRGFFNLIEFSLLDKDGDGVVDASETMTVFYRRYGKEGALKQIQALVEQEKLDSTMTFTDYLKQDIKMSKSARSAVQSGNRKAPESPKRHVVLTAPR